MAFVVSTFAGQNENSHAYTQSLIAIKENGIITSFTGLEKAANAFPQSNIRHVSASNRTTLIFANQFLNHLVRNYGLTPREVPFARAT